MKREQHNKEVTFAYWRQSAAGRIITIIFGIIIAIIDWGTLRAVVMGLNVDLHCLRSAELKSLKDIPQHYVDKKYNALHSTLYWRWQLPF